MMLPDIYEFLPIIFATFSGAFKPALTITFTVSYLNRCEKYELNSFIYCSSVTSLIICVVLSFLVNSSSDSLIVLLAQYLSGVAPLIMIITLTYLSWSTIQPRQVIKVTAVEIIGFISLTFAVVAEKFESVTFLTTAFSINPFVVAIGTATGIILILGLAGSLEKMISKFNDEHFFRYTSLFLILFAAASLVTIAHELIEGSRVFGIELGLLEKNMFDINPQVNVDGSYPALHENGLIGSILQETFGYDGNPEILTVITYAAYWLLVCMYFLKRQEPDQISLIGVSRRITGRDLIGRETGIVKIYGELEKNSIKKRMKNLEGVVEDQTKKLKEAERLATIGQTASMVGHDLRNPLQTIFTVLYLANKKVDSLPSHLGEKNSLGELLSSLEEHVSYMDKIVSDLQDYSRTLKPEFLQTNIEKIITETASTLRFPEKVKYESSFEDGIPPLWVDSQMIQRVFTNLYTNAIQAMPKGGLLTARVYKAGSQLNIEVQDTGTGVPKENLPKLFVPLFTTKAKGQGLGLAVCKRIVDAHDGVIAVKSEVGKGTAFIVSLPLRRQTTQ